jgi:hypothetical protein
VPSKDAPGGQVVIPSRAQVGLSKEFRDLLEERARKGVDVPTLYKNPGAYGHVARLSRDEVLAVPPPARPLWPMEESEQTWKYVRGFSLVLPLVALAAYLHYKKSLASGSARLELERRHPRLAEALVQGGILRDYAAAAAGLDRALLFSRVFARYTPEEGGGGGGASSAAAAAMPASRAVRLLAALVGSESVAQQAVEAEGLSGKVKLTQPEFGRLFARGAASVPDALLYVASDELFGVVPCARPVLDALGELHDKVVEARARAAARARGGKASSSSSSAAAAAAFAVSSGGGSTAFFTPASLAELAGEVGFTSDEAFARSFLADCAAAATGQVTVPELAAAATEAAAAAATPAAPGADGKDGAGAAATAPFAAPLRRSEFVDFMAASAAAAGLTDEERISQYLRVFYMLHMSGIREQAGVKAV